MLSPYSIGDLRIEPGLVLAPMSGVTTSAFRRLIKEFNPGAVGLMLSEFVSVEAMTRRVERSLAMMRFAEMERPFGIQIFGHDIQRMSDAARMVQDAGADLLDINCGCPAPKVVRKGGGCELMRQPEHLQQILAAVRKSVSIPLSLKMRSGWDFGCRNAVQIARIAEGEGVQALAVHGRTRTQLYRGDADWGAVEEVAAAVKIPICGSGDVVDFASAQKRKSGPVAGLFIGRGALANPCVFSDILEGRQASRVKDPRLVLRILERYVELLREEFSDKFSVGRLKQLASPMCRGFPWRKDLCLAMNFNDQIAIIKREKDRLFERSLENSSSAGSMICTPDLPDNQLSCANQDA